jgi:TetR/AcrR family transcriptional regulator
MIKSNDQDDTRDRLFEAALTCFSQSGFKGTTTRAICELAGVNLALLSYHWGSKAKLFEAVVQEFHRRLFAIAQQGIACGSAHADLADAVRGFLEVVTRDLLADPRGLRVMAWAQLAPEGFDPSIVHAAYQPAIQAGAALLRQAQSQGRIDANVDVELALVTYYGLVAEPVLEPAVHRQLFGVDHTHPEHALRLQRHLVRSGLALLGLKEKP